MNAKTGLTLVGLVLAALALGLVFLVGGDLLDDNPGFGGDYTTENGNEEPAELLQAGDGNRGEDGRDDGGANRRAMEDVEPGDAPRPMLAVRGQVLNERGGGVPGAEVALYLRQDLGSMFRSGRGFGGRGGRRRGRGGSEDWRRLLAMKAAGRPIRTDRDGWFTLRGQGWPETDLEIAVNHARFAPTVVRRSWEAKEGNITLDAIQLDQGITIAGTVVDDEKAPIAGATVTFRVDRGRGGGRGGRGGRSGFDQSDVLQNMIPPVTTRRDGSFQLVRLPAIAFQLAAEAKRYLPATTRRVELKPGEQRRAEIIQLPNH